MNKYSKARRTFLLSISMAAVYFAKTSWASDFLNPKEWKPSDKPLIKPMEPLENSADSADGVNNQLCSFNPAILIGGLGARAIACPQSDWNDPYGRTLMEVIHYLHHRPDHYVVGPKPGSRNATAYLCGIGEHRRKAIDWDPQFLWELSQRARTKYAATAVLLHELGHHVNDDMSIPTGPERELWADSFAGYHMARVGIPQREAVAVFSLMGSGGKTHPPAGQRVAAAATGWQKGMRRGY